MPTRLAKRGQMRTMPVRLAAVLACASAASALALVPAPSCSAASFPTALTDTMCMGLQQKVRNKMGAPIKSEAECLDACCEDGSCTIYQ